MVCHPRALLEKDHPTHNLETGDYTLGLGIARHDSFTTLEFPAGIFVRVGPDEYTAGGRGLTVSFIPKTPGDLTAGLATIEKGDHVHGRWVAGRRLNGDEFLSGKGPRFGAEYAIQHVKLYRYH